MTHYILLTHKSKLRLYEMNELYRRMTRELNSVNIPLKILCDERDFDYNQLNNKFNLFKSDYAMYVGNSIFPIIDYALNHPEVDKFIVQEYDVRFCGNYGYLINKLPLDNNDVIFQEYLSDAKDWYWEKTLNVRGNKKHCLLQWYMISREALMYIHECYKQGYNGHYEGVVPTIINNSKFKVEYLCNFFPCFMSDNKDQVIKDMSLYLKRKNEQFFVHPIK